MHYVAIWNWFIDQGLVRDIIAWVVGFLCGALVAWLKVMPLWKEHIRHQRRIADLLDTKTPGGLSDVIKALDMPSDPGEEQRPSHHQKLHLAFYHRYPV